MLAKEVDEFWVGEFEFSTGEQAVVVGIERGDSLEGGNVKAEFAFDFAGSDGDAGVAGVGSVGVDSRGEAAEERNDADE